MDSAPDKDLSESLEQALELDPTSQCSSTPELGSDSSKRLPTSKRQSPPERTPTPDSDEANEPPSTPRHSPTPRAGSEPSRTFPSPLHREIDSQPHAAAEERKLTLMRMTSYEFDRECNMANNRAMGRSLGLKGGLFGNSKAKENKKTRKRSAKLTGRVPQKDTHRVLRRSVLRRSILRPVVRPPVVRPPVTRVSKSQVTQDPEQAEQMLSTNAPLVEVTNSSQTPASLTSALSSTQRSPKSASINRTAWPKWLTEKYDHYAALEFGDMWTECLTVWTELERAFGFRNPVS